jgi:hypothetical protein
MEGLVRPISRLAAVELAGSDLEIVIGGCCPQTAMSRWVDNGDGTSTEILYYTPDC